MAVDKLVDSSQLDLDLTSVANAIRAKSGGIGYLQFPSGFVSEINSIAGGPTLDDWLNDLVNTVNFSGSAIKQYAFAYHVGSDGNGVAFNLPNLTAIQNGAFNYTKVKSFSAPLVSSISGNGFYMLFPASGDGVIVAFPSITTLAVSTSLGGFAAQNGTICPVLLSLPNFTGRTSSGYSQALFGYSSTPITYACGITEITQDTQKNVLPQSGVRVYIPLMTSCLKYDFANISTLLTAELPNMLTVAEYAFYADKALTTVDLRAATTIGQFAFYNCTALTTIDLRAATSIGGSAFYGDKALTSIDLPLATTIGESAFYGCTALTSASMPSATSLGATTFRGCTNLTTVDISSATSLNSSQTFYGCSKLESVTMPNVTVLGYQCFNSCVKLSNLDTSKITSISTYTFAYCNSLTSLDFGKLTAVPQYGVQNCANLKTVTLRKNTTLYQAAFQNCSNLDTLIIDLDDPTGTLPVLNVVASSVFSGTKLANATSGGAIYVTDSRVNDLKARTNWTTLSDIIHPLSELPSA